MNWESYHFLKGGPTNWGYVVILIVITFLVAGGVLSYAKYVFEEIASLSQFPEIEIRKKIKDETAKWKTYRNEEYGFEIKYPKGWKYTEGSQIKPDARGHYIVAFGKIVPAQDYPFVIKKIASTEEAIGTIYQKNSLIIDIWAWGPANPEEYAISQKMLSTFRFLSR